jgi:energy-coupling factor transporter ATP-binding protein EcfA2
MQLDSFKITNYRNIIDSGWIDLNQVTAFVGQNESGKSNLFEALYCINPFVAADTYNIHEDWPVDRWGDRDETAIVCEAKFKLAASDIVSLYAAAGIPKPAPVAAPTETPPPLADGAEPMPPAEPAKPQMVPPVLPEALTLLARRTYDAPTAFSFEQDTGTDLDPAKVDAWFKESVPKFVYIRDYELSGAQVELNELADRLKQKPWHELSNDDQTIKIVLDLAKIDIDDFVAKGTSAAGRTIRTFDKRSASAYLSKQFRDLWRQKRVDFDIEIDATTLNILARDEGLGMPVRLSRRSSGFRWHVSFAWKFTHASRGQYKGCVLLLEEPGVHLHYSGQRDLLEVFDRLSADNIILYTTHLASMVDLANPERVRIVEPHDSHSVVLKGVVSSQGAPMAVIEAALGLTGDLSGLLGTRQTLIVEGGDDALVLHKLSGLMRAAGKPHLSERIYPWPARGAPKTPMYAAFAVGQRWDAGVLLDSDRAGRDAEKKIKEQLKDFASAQGTNFRVLMLRDAAGIKKTDAGIEDLFDDAFYLDCVNAAYKVAIASADLPVDGSDMITKRVESVLQRQYGRDEVDKRLVMAEILRRFDTWHDVADLPKGTSERAEQLFEKINSVFATKK